MEAHKIMINVAFAPLAVVRGYEFVEIHGKCMIAQLCSRRVVSGRTELLTRQLKRNRFVWNGLNRSGSFQTLQ